MKTLHEFADTLKAALAVIEGANAAEERARLANIALANAQNAKRQVEMAAAAAKAAAAADIGKRNDELATLHAEHTQKLAAEKAEHDRYVENAKAQVLQASEALTALQAEIAEARLVRDNINAENAKLLAAFGESAKKLGHG